MAAIIVKSNNQRVPEINVLTLFPNETWKFLQTNPNGEATPTLHKETLRMMVFAAADGYKGVIKGDWVPADRNLKLEMQELWGGEIQRLGSCFSGCTAGNNSPEGAEVQGVPYSECRR